MHRGILDCLERERPAPGPVVHPFTLEAVDVFSRGDVQVRGKEGSTEDEIEAMGCCEGSRTIRSVYINIILRRVTFRIDGATSLWDELSRAIRCQSFSSQQVRRQSFDAALWSQLQFTN